MQGEVQAASQPMLQLHPAASQLTPAEYPGMARWPTSSPAAAAGSGWLTGGGRALPPPCSLEHIMQALESGSSSSPDSPGPDPGLWHQAINSSISSRGTHSVRATSPPRHTAWPPHSPQPWTTRSQHRGSSSEAVAEQQGPQTPSGRGACPHPRGPADLLAGSSRARQGTLKAIRGRSQPQQLNRHNCLDAGQAQLPAGPLQSHEGGWHAAVSPTRPCLGAGAKGGPAVPKLPLAHALATMQGCPHPPSYPAHLTSDIGPHATLPSPLPSGAEGAGPAQWQAGASSCVQAECQPLQAHPGWSGQRPPQAAPLSHRLAGSLHSCSGSSSDSSDGSSRSAGEGGEEEGCAFASAPDGEGSPVSGTAGAGPAGSTLWPAPDSGSSPGAWQLPRAVAPAGSSSACSLPEPGPQPSPLGGQPTPGRPLVEGQGWDPLQPPGWAGATRLGGADKVGVTWAGVTWAPALPLPITLEHGRRGHTAESQDQGQGTRVRLRKSEVQCKQATGPVSGPNPTDAASLLPGQVSELELIKYIGRGSYGEVYQALWRGSLLAVKVLRWPCPPRSPCRLSLRARFPSLPLGPSLPAALHSAASLQASHPCADAPWSGHGCSPSPGCQGGDHQAPQTHSPRPQQPGLVRQAEPTRPGGWVTTLPAGRLRGGGQGAAARPGPMNCSGEPDDTLDHHHHHHPHLHKDQQKDSRRKQLHKEPQTLQHHELELRDTSSGGRCVASAPPCSCGVEAARQALAAHDWEARVGRQLSHANLVATYTACRAPQPDGYACLAATCRAGPGLAWHTWLVMEHCDRGSLEGAVRQGAFKRQQPRQLLPSSHPAGTLELDMLAVAQAARDGEWTKGGRRGRGGDPQQQQGGKQEEGAQEQQQGGGATHPQASSEGKEAAAGGAAAAGAGGEESWAEGPAAGTGPTGRAGDRLKGPQATCSSQAATQPAASEPGPSTPLPAKRSKRNEAEQAAEPTQPTKSKGKAQGKAAKAKPAPQPGRWVDRDCTAALNMQRSGESRWRPLELCYWPEEGKLPAKGKEYPGLGYKRLRNKPLRAQQQQQQQQSTTKPTTLYQTPLMVDTLEPTPSPITPDSLLVLLAACAVCAGLAYMHAMGLVHGDLKPANCLLQSAKPTVDRPLTFIVKLADFGSSCPAAPSLSTSPSLGTNGAFRQPVPHGPEPLRCSLSPDHWEAAAAADAWRVERPDQDLGQSPRRHGGGVRHCRTTPCRSWAQAAGAGAPGVLSGGVGCGGALSHAAPEVVAGQAASQAADVWSLGVLLWQMVSGEVPYAGMPAAQLLLRKARLARHVTSVSSPASLLPASCSAACPATGLESDRLSACSLPSCRPDVGESESDSQDGKAHKKRSEKEKKPKKEKKASTTPSALLGAILGASALLQLQQQAHALEQSGPGVLPLAHPLQKKNKHKDKAKDGEADIVKQAKQFLKAQLAASAAATGPTAASDPGAQQGPSPSPVAVPPPTLPEAQRISDAEHYFLKGAEFSAWLQEERNMFSAELPTERSHQLFQEFAGLWNAQLLADKYYAGAVAAPLKRTSHNWGIKTAGMAGGAGGAGQDDSRAVQKKEQARWRAEQKEVLEELLPRATGREAQVEKRIARRYLLLLLLLLLLPLLLLLLLPPPPLLPPPKATWEESKAREGSPDTVRLPGGGDVYGGDTSLAAAKAWEAQRVQSQRNRLAARQDEVAARVAVAQAKENERMAQFRALAAIGPITIAKRQT
ncbi:hypothetical protein QJQ45_002456 [Haematococcus lacustris]|nr:hypothetical protein QJQ45_002456 [Haematococcus lacustris]